MPSWNQLLDEFEQIRDHGKRTKWLRTKQVEALEGVAAISGRKVILYMSAFLMKPQAPANLIQITHEDINGFMSVLYGLDCTSGLTLLLHTPGGVPNAAETIVAYLRSKFPYVEVIVPTYAMSAGTMISLSANRIIMGRQSQLGPIDPQFIFRERALSARAIVDQFEQAKKEVVGNLALAHVWAPVLQTIGPALLQEALNALDYGQKMVARWLEQYMFAGRADAHRLAAVVAAYFNDAGIHKSHGRRIDREEARKQELNIADLEDDQKLQERVLTAYHIATIGFQQGPATKVIACDSDRLYVKNWAEGAPIAMPTRR
jgi:hypothetical protein